MDTTIQVSKELKDLLSERKLWDSETYEDVIWSLLEDSMELSEETKKNVTESLADIKAGRTYSLEEVKRRMDVRSKVLEKRREAVQQA